MKADPKQALEGTLSSGGPALDLARAQAEVIRKLAGVNLELAAGAAPRGAGAVHSSPEFDLALRLPLAQAGAQRTRLEKQIEQLEKLIAGSRRQLEDPTFLGRAPAHVVDSIRRKLAEYESQLEKSRVALEGLPPA